MKEIVPLKDLSLDNKPLPFAVNITAVGDSSSEPCNWYSPLSPSVHRWPSYEMLIDSIGNGEYAHFAIAIMNIGGVTLNSYPHLLISIVNEYVTPADTFRGCEKIPDPSSASQVSTIKVPPLLQDVTSGVTIAATLAIVATGNNLCNNFINKILFCTILRYNLVIYIYIEF
ncbi:MAG: hypothetical protein MJ233_05465 [Mycoplasmoidaceae bacterium]|nr:hypothetical protein [Mycoplasmoidaceae bacterium]